MIVRMLNMEMVTVWLMVKLLQCLKIQRVPLVEDTNMICH